MSISVGNMSSCRDDYLTRFDLLLVQIKVSLTPPGSGLIPSDVLLFFSPACQTPVCSAHSNCWGQPTSPSASTVSPDATPTTQPDSGRRWGRQRGRHRRTGCFPKEVDDRVHGRIKTKAVNVSNPDHDLR